MLNVAENPLVLILLCWLVAICAGSMWYYVARHWLPATLAVVALIASLVLMAVSMWVVTDREKIRQTIRDLAAAVQANDREGVVHWISNSAPETQEKARREMELCSFSQCWVTKIDEIQFESDRQSATVAVMIYCSALHQIHGEGSAMVQLFLEVRLDPDQTWRLADFDYAIQSGL